MVDWKLIHCMCLLIFCCISNFVLFSVHLMGKRKFSLSVHRKNEERKRWRFYPIRILLDLLSLQVSLSISVVKDSTASSLATLRARFASVGSLPAGE